MASFKLDDATLGVLGGGFYKTVPFDFAGSGREIKISLLQVATQDMEPKWLEVHFTINGTSKEDL